MTQKVPFILIPLILIAMLVTSCSSSGQDAGSQDQDNEENDEWFQPTAGTTWQWQLNGDLNTGYDVEVYDIDLANNSVETVTSLHDQGRMVICYFSAGSYEDFREDADQFPEEVLGNPLEDFPDERWLDIRSEDVLSLMSARMDTAVEKGCDGVEPDNVDGYANDSGFDLTAEDQLLFNTQIADAAHERGLAVGLKNDLDQVEALVDHFDFSVNEQCHEFDECDLLEPFLDADKAVFNAEYEEAYVHDADTRDEICQDAMDRGFSTLILPVDLDDSFRLTCD